MTKPTVEDVLRALQSGRTRDLTVRGIAPDGHITELQIESDSDAELAKKHFPHLLTPPPSVPPVSSNLRYPKSAAHSVPVSGRRASFEQRLKDENRTVKYQRECSDALQMLIDICGDLPPDDYEPDTIDKFVERVKFLPKNPDKDPEYREHWRTRNHFQRSQAVELLGLTPISSTTVNKHIARLSAFFAHCIERRYMQTPHNPMAGRVAKPNRTKGNAAPVKNERNAFTMPELEAIFDPECYKSRKRPHMFWPPLIAMMTGARVNEIAQLYLDDIVDDDSAHPGRWRFMILPKRPDQRVKNESSIRSIPIHPKLIDLGFLDYVADVRALGYDRLFPNLIFTQEQGYGGDPSERFMEYLRKKVGIKDPKKVFHSFRHYFCTTMFNLPTKPDRMYIVELTGHERAGVFETSYARELHYENKLSLLLQLPLPELKIARYAKGSAAKFFAVRERDRAAAARRKAQKALAGAAADTEGGSAATSPASGTPTSAAQFTIKRKRTKK